jgi:hypothetical protein
MPALAAGFDTLQIAPARHSIPEVITRGEKFSNVIVKRVSETSITLEHTDGVKTCNLGEFDQVNLDRLFPGYLEKKRAREAARFAAEERQKQRTLEDVQLLESNLQAAVSDALRSAPNDAEPLACVLVAGRGTYLIGEYPQIAVRIVNRSSKEVFLIGSLDGSGDQRRFPHCHYEVIGPRGESIPPAGGWCGNMNHLRTADFVPVPANDTFNPFGKGFFSAYPFHRIVITEPGTYRVRFVYSTSSKDLRHYAGFPGWSPVDDILPLFNRVSHVTLAGKELKLKFEARSQ